jgi:NAD(P)H-nitrite reductase large subunit
MTADAAPTADRIDLADDALVCYCTHLTFGELSRACREGRWPLPEKDRSGKLCTGCVGDLLHCLRALAASRP